MPENTQREPWQQFLKRPAFSSLPPDNRKYILLFCATTFFFWTALYLYVPILPVYTRSLGANLSMVGTVVAAYAIPQVLFRIPVGVLFDAMTKRKLLLALGVLMAALGALGLGFAPSPWFLFLARIVTGIGATTWVTFTVFFTAFYPEGSVRQAIGLINFVQGTAVLTATFCGGIIAEVWGAGFTFWGATGLGVVALMALLSIREPAVAHVESASWRRFTLVATYPQLLLVSFMGILAQFANWAGLFGFIPVYAVQIGASEADLGIITMLALASGAVVALAVASIARRWGNVFTIVLGAILLGSTTLIVPLIHDVSALEIVMVVNGLGRGILATILMSLSIQAVAPQQRATAMGVYQALYAVGMLLGPLISGHLADSLGLTVVFYLSAAICLLLAGTAFLLRRTRQGQS